MSARLSTALLPVPAELTGIRLSENTGPQHRSTAVSQRQTRQPPRVRRSGSERGNEPNHSGSASKREPRTTSFCNAGSPLETEVAAQSTDVCQLTTEEQISTQALLNFVAFGYKDKPKRFFLFGEETVPPPPPKKPKRVTGGSASSSTNQGEAEKANADAQTVLRGLLNTKTGVASKRVTLEVYRRLIDSNVAPTDTTFNLLIESSAAAGDVDSTSMLVNSMEAAGYCANDALLDKVMALYTLNQNASCKVAVAPTNGKVSDPVFE